MNQSWMKQSVWNRRRFLSTTACALTGLYGSQGQAARRPPNIVLILIDDLGWKDLGCYGSRHIATPNIDRFAEESMRFTQAYSNCPVCSPSRAALLTGKNPARLQFTGHITAIGKHRHPEDSRIIPPDDRMDIPHEETTIAEALKPAGYVSASIGKWHVGSEDYWPERQGFDVNIGGWTHGSPPNYFYPYTAPEISWNPSIPTLEGGKPGEYLTDRLTDEAVQFIQQNQNTPFFLYLTHYAVHTPLQAPEALVNKYKTKLAERNTGIDPTYAAMVENMDFNVGKVLRTLEELRLSDNTLVIFFSDNGGLKTATNNAPLREGKGWLYEGGIRVPLIMRWPKKISAGKVCNEPVIGTDLFTTIVETAGVEMDDRTNIDGVNLLPLWSGEEKLNRGALYWYYPHYSPQSKEPCAAIRQGHFKLLEFYDPPRVELYNLNEDIGETRNIIHQSPQKAEEMKRKLDRYLRRVNAKMHTMNPGH